MRSFNEYITEVFNNPFDFKLDPSQISFGDAYTFKTENDDLIVVEFIQANKNDLPDFAPNSYELTFSNDSDTSTGSFDLSNRGEAFRIFATIGKIIPQFIKLRKPDAVIFSSAKANRSKLYSSLVKKLKIPKYSIAVSTRGGTGKFFTIINSGLLRKFGTDAVDGVVGSFS